MPLCLLAYLSRRRFSKNVLIRKDSFKTGSLSHAQYRAMEDNMACENTPTDFAERVDKELYEEHLRFARELRHTLLPGLLPRLLQGFLSVSMRLCFVDAPLPVDSPTKPILGLPFELMRKGFDKGRGALLGVRVAALPDGSLEKALGDVCDDFLPRSRTRVRMVIVGETRLLVPAVQEHVYWIAREALLNALRHSAATRVEAEIEYLPRKLRVVVRDDGAGIDAKTLPTGRSDRRGLTSMQERAASIGAKVRVWTKRGGGTEVEISLPILKKPA
jgi:signal transduction histidine kinase